MRLDFDADVEAFRAEFVDFLTANLPTTADASTSASATPHTATAACSAVVKRATYAPSRHGARRSTLARGSASTRIRLPLRHFGARLHGVDVLLEGLGHFRVCRLHADSRFEIEELRQA